MTKTRIIAHHCFACNTVIGTGPSDKYDELDTCGKIACRREANQEAYDRAQEASDWACS